MRRPRRNRARRRLAERNKRRQDRRALAKGQRSKQKRLAKRDPQDLFLGVQDAGQPFMVPRRQLATHGLWTGKSGCGKSTALLQTWLQFLKMRNVNTVIIQGKTGLCEDALKICKKLGVPPQAVVLLDGNDATRAVGMNALTAIGGSSAATIAKRTVEAVKKVYNQANFMPLLEVWGPPSLEPLIAAGFTLAEWYSFVGLDDDAYVLREAVLDNVADDLETKQALKLWRGEFLAQPEQKRTELTQVLRSRASLVMNSPSLLLLLGQVRPTVPWEAFLNEAGGGRVLLASLGPGPHLTEQEGRLLGATLLNLIAQAAECRKPGRSYPQLIVIIDEAAMFLTREHASSLQKHRSFGVSYIMATQTVLGQLFAEDEVIGREVLGNVGAVVAFSTDHADAQLLSQRFMAGRYDTNEVKDELHSVGFWPTFVREKTYSNSTTVTETYSSSHSTSESHGSGMSDGVSQVMGHLADGQTVVSSGAASNDGYARGDSAGEAHSVAHTESEGDVPFHRLVPFSQVSSRQFTPLPELQDRAVGALLHQPRAHAVMAMGADPPVAVRIPKFIPPKVSERELSEYREAVLSWCTRPRAEIMEEIEKRIPLYIERWLKKRQRRRVQRKQEQQQALDGFAAALAGTGDDDDDPT